MKFQARLLSEQEGISGFQVEWATEFECASILVAMDMVRNKLADWEKGPAFPSFSQLAITEVPLEKEEKE